jgi:hypothetical protein
MALGFNVFVQYQLENGLTWMSKNTVLIVLHDDDALILHLFDRPAMDAAPATRAP